MVLVALSGFGGSGGSERVPEEMKIAEAWSRFSALLPPISSGNCLRFSSTFKHICFSSCFLLMYLDFTFDSESKRRAAARDEKTCKNTHFATKQRKYRHRVSTTEKTAKIALLNVLSTHYRTKHSALWAVLFTRKRRLSKISTNCQKRTLWIFFLLCHSAVIHIEGRHVATCLAVLHVEGNMVKRRQFRGSTFYKLLLTHSMKHS